ncbi:MAG: ImmA/IrrE family metallo-endopeptidase [Bacteroidales bacterium]|jgi:hypothetical protein|nr:ImmA/IrrE family metallo-endopeptidase [Bacteroidales bacterium]
MKLFSSTQEVSWINGPAAVDLNTAVLYINPAAWNKLSEMGKKFVIAHELGHLNAAEDNEMLADRWAFWRCLELGDDTVDILKAYYKSLPFTTKQQIARGEELLQTALSTDNDNTSVLRQVFDTKIPNNANIHEFIGLITAGVSAAVSITGSLVKGIKQNKTAKALASAEKEAAKQSEREVESSVLQTKAELQYIKKLEEEAALRDAAANSKTQQQSSMLPIVIVVAVIAIGIGGVYMYNKFKN